VRDKVQFKN